MSTPGCGSQPPEVGGRVAKYVELYDRECPRSPADVQSLVQEFGLRHGDVVSFDEYRDTESYIAYSQENETPILIRNPDDSGSGYLTIPKEVLVNIRDAVDLYKDLIDNQLHSVNNLHVSPQDKFVVDRIGQVPKDWEIDIVYTLGWLEVIGVKVPGYNEDEFDLSTFTRPVIEARYLSGSPLVSVHVRVEVHGEDYHRYMAKYDFQSSPSVPTGWLVDSYGGSSGGGDHRTWGWKFSGPQSGMEEVVKSIKYFLEGFSYSLS